jgi:hypothetical protein
MAGFESSRKTPSSGPALPAARPPARHSGSAELFRNALENYRKAAGTARQAWLMEAIVRAGRGVAYNTDQLDAADREIMNSIRDRYRAFSNDRQLPTVSTYADAHLLLKQLFF